MKISYNWLKSYIPEIPEPNKLADIFASHLCEVESLEKNSDGDYIFDIKILPDRAHDLLSHLGVAHELASLLNIKFVDPTPKYRIPRSTSSGQAELKIDIQSDKCRRYMGRIVRNVKVGPSPEWVAKHLESIGQRSINNMVDAANIVMFDCGQPVHAFDLAKTKEEIIVRYAKDGEEMTTLDNKEVRLKDSNMIIATSPQPSPERRGGKGGEVLALAGIKGGKFAEVDSNTKDIILEVANFDPTSIRKTAQSFNIVTDAKKRFENDLSPELGAFAMKELSALIWDMCPEAVFEEVVDMYPKKQETRKLSFSVGKISKILGLNVFVDEIKDILKRYNFEYNLSPNPSPDRRGARGEVFEITVPSMRLDLTIEEDMAEEIGRIMGYDKVKPQIPKINFKPKVNETYAKIISARHKLLGDGYSEVMTYAFKDSGEVEVLASASDKKFLRTNLADGLKESLKLNNINAPLLDMKEIKIFEIGTVFKKNGEEMHVAWGDKKEIKEMKLEEFYKNSPLEEYPLSRGRWMSTPSRKRATPQEGNKFKPWSNFPFISRDVAVWVVDKNDKEKLEKLFSENGTELLIKEPYLFDSFTNGKDGRTSYAFRLVFQSYDRTLTDEEVSKIMAKISDKINANGDWQIR